MSDFITIILSVFSSIPYVTVFQYLLVGFCFLAVILLVRKVIYG